MLALRYAAVLALAFWLGGLVVLGAIAAPAAFDVLGARGPEGRVLAGQVFGETVKRFHSGVYISGAIVILTLAVRRVLGPRPRLFAARLIVSIVMIAAVVWSALVLTPRIEHAQQAIDGPASALPAGDPRRVALARAHGTFTSIQLVPILGGLVLLFFELRD